MNETDTETLEALTGAERAMLKRWKIADDRRRSRCDKHGRYLSGRFQTACPACRQNLARIKQEQA
jgi:Zn finger protein HypA/HybF involved in hydrogenase expression